MATFDLITLGGFELRDETGAAIPLASRKAQAMLALLAETPGKPVPRAKLAGLIWADRGDEQARGSLRQALSVLRRALDDQTGETLISSRDNLAIDADRMRCDASQFEALLANETRPDLERAIALYQGPFMDGYDARDAGLEDWLADTRARLAERAVAALGALAEQCSADGDIDDALVHLARLLAIDPLREDMHREAMRLYMEAGRPTEAVRQYEQCRSVLYSDLAVEPQLETRQFYAEILTRRDRGSVADSTARYKPSVSATQEGAGKPSIAVMPFQNLSGDPDQEFFADGMTEDIITELSRFRSLMVIARNSTFVYKGKPVDTARIAEDLRVGYVLEGSVRTGADQIRVSAQLIDAPRREHIWAERYDRPLADMFALQDEITQTIVAALTPELDGVERARAASANRERLDAWAAYQRGMWHLYRFTKDDTGQALALFEQAIGFEPGFAAAWSGKSFVHFSNAFLGFADDREAERQAALETARQSVELDPRDATAHWALARAHMLLADYDRAIAEFETAIELNPNFAQAHYQLGWVMVRAGRPEKALAPISLAERLSPNDPLRFAFDTVRAQVHFVNRDFNRALDWAERAARLPHAHAHIEAIRIACLVQTGQAQAAEAAMEKFRDNEPHYTQSFFLDAHRFARPEDAALYLDALAEAGLPA